MKAHRDAAKVAMHKKLASYGGSSKGIGSNFESAEPVDSEQRESKPDKEPGLTSIKMAKNGGMVKRLDKSPRTGRATGGVVTKEGSAKDKAEDKVLAKQHHMSMKDWEKSKADEEHDEKACGGRTKRASGGKVFEGSAKDEAEDKVLAKKAGMSKSAWEKSDLDKEHDRAERADGGRVGKAKGGRTNIVINLGGNPAGGQAAAAPPPMPMMMKQPMPPAPPVAPGPMAPMPGGPPVPPMGGPAVVNPMQRAKGGRVNKDVDVKAPGRTGDGYVKMDYAALGGKGRRQKIEAQSK